MKRSFLCLALAASFAAPAVYSPAFAQTPPAAPTEAPKKSEPSYNDLIKDSAKMDGVFTIYRTKKGTSDQVLLEVKEDQLDKLYLLQATASTGTGGTPMGVFHGSPLNDFAFRMHIVDDARVIFTQPNLSIRAGENPETQRALGRAHPDTVLGSFDIKSRNSEKKTLLIDVGDFFRGDIADVSGDVERSGYGLDPRSAYLDSIKVLPHNFVIRTVYRLNRRSAAAAGPRSFPFAVSYNFSILPETGYKPRLSDTRVGYFTTTFSDVSEAEKNDQTVNFILRWNLEKQDPNAALSAPKKPIVFYIDNAVPKAYRPAVREGLEMYNTAFEKVGFKDAIVVKQMPDDADWDIADVRYNVVRWTVGMPFAIALFRENPLTGEILNACINMDAVFAAGAVSSFDNIIDPMAAKPEQNWIVADKYKSRLCTFQHEGAEQIAMAKEALDLIADSPEYASEKDRIVHEYIREVVAHEMGHVLGLRHNFIASTNLSAEQLGDAATVKREGVTATVMDYAPYNVFAIGKKDVPFYSTTVGPYDNWAIDYGYRSIPGATPKDEVPVLNRIARRTNEPGLGFQTDDMADNWDPLVLRFDLGKDPLAWSQRRFEVSKKLMTSLGLRKPKSGESYYEFTRSFNALNNNTIQAATYAARFIGGVHANSNFKGDVNEQPTIVPIDAVTQKRALGLINRYFFAKGSFDFPKSYLARLQGNPNSPGSQASSTQRLFPVLSQISANQRFLLSSLFTPARLTRIANNEYRAASPGQTLSLAQLFRSVGNDVWTELRTGDEIDPVRRSLQREHLSEMIDFVLTRPADAPDDAFTLAHEQLVGIRSMAAKALPTAKGEYGKAHLQEVIARIDQTLSAKVVVPKG